MDIDSRLIIDGLERFGNSLRAVVEGLPDEQAVWKPADGAWSVLEIVTHLADEEVEDFRARVRSTLEDPGRPWDPIDPEGWARDRRYNDGLLAEAVDRFCREREQSVAWLRGLSAPAWSRAYEHPRFGPIHAGDLLASWAAHDALHLRQIAKRLFQLAEVHAGDYRTRYAGPWKA